MPARTGERNLPKLRFHTSVHRDNPGPSARLAATRVGALFVLHLAFHFISHTNLLSLRMHTHVPPALAKHSCLPLGLATVLLASRKVPLVPQETATPPISRSPCLHFRYSLVTRVRRTTSHSPALLFQTSVYSCCHFDNAQRLYLKETLNSPSSDWRIDLEILILGIAVLCIFTFHVCSRHDLLSVSKNAHPAGPGHVIG